MLLLSFIRMSSTTDKYQDDDKPMSLVNKGYNTKVYV